MRKLISDKLKPFYILAPIIWGMLLYPLPLMAAKVYEGKNLSQALEIEIRNDVDIVVIAEQLSADYVLTLIEGNSQEVIRVANVSNIRPLEEMMLVRKGECEACILEIKGRSKIDQSSPYRVIVETLEHSSSELIDAYWNITQAAGLLGQVHTAPESQRERLFEKSTSELQKVIEVTSADAFYLTHHAATLLTWIKEQQGQIEDYTSLFNQILTEAGGEKSIFRIYALYGLARLESKTEIKEKFYRDAIHLAEQIDHAFLIAKGKNLLAVLYVREGRHEQALKFLNEAYRGYLEIKNWRALFDPLHNLSWAHRRAGNLAKAITFATQLKLLAEGFEDDETILWALYDFASAYGDMGERLSADLFLQQAFDRMKQMPIYRRTELAHLEGYLLQEQSKVLLSYGDIDRAKDFADQMLASFGGGNFKDRAAEALFLTGEIELAAGNYKSARSIFEQSLTYANENNLKRSAGRHHLKYAELEMAGKNYIAAAEHQAVALKTLSQAEDYGLVAKALSQAAELLHWLGATQDANHLLEKADALNSQYGKPSDRALFAYRRALVEKSLGNIDNALRSLEKSRSIINSELPKVLRRDLRRHFIALQHSLFELNISLSLEKHGVEPNLALDVAESYKARTLEESIFYAHGKHEMSKEDKELRAEIHKKILNNTAKWLDAQADVELDLIADTRALSFKLETLEANFLKQKRNSLSRIEKKIGIPKYHPTPGQLVLYYFIGKQESWLWAINDKASSVYALPREDEIKHLAQAVKSQLVMHPGDRHGRTAWQLREAVTNLSEAVIGPVREQIYSNGTNHLIIIADGPLMDVPFSALKLKEAKHPLITDVAISYAPSLGVLDAFNNTTKTNEPSIQHKALVVANPLFRNESNRTFQQLPNTEKEAKLIEQLLGEHSTVLNSESAVKSLFLKELKKNYQILHLATHGWANKLEPSMSGLAFSDQDGEERFWLAPEISTSNLKPDLVIMSACETSTGKQINGEGLMSLSRAFIEGGAKQVIGTLWMVQDQATAELIREFYFNLLDKGLSAHEALQHAQISVYSNNDFDWTDPYFWSGFQLQGGKASISHKGNSI